MFGFFVIFYKVYKDKNSTGLSMNTIYCYIIAFFFRLCSILFFEGYIISSLRN